MSDPSHATDLDDTIAGAPEVRKGGARAEPADGELPVGTMVDHFEVRRLLASGGMGQVYVARDTKLGRRVALKLVRRALLRREKAKIAFQSEARTMARFSHPNIVGIHAVGEFDGVPYVALEYVEGDTLRERLDAGAMSPPEALRICLSIARALEEAHRHGVLHRDLKPENVVLGRDGRVRVLDFGLAKTFAHEPTPDGAPLPVAKNTTEGLKGTPQYMAPEQWGATQSTPATDVWAVGEVIFELLTQRCPFEAESVAGLFVAVAGPDAAPRLDELVEAPEALVELVAGCLSKDPANRPGMSEVVAELEALVSARRASSGESSPFRGLFPFTERHADMFFGREREIAEFVERLRQSPILPVVGPSGAGKSSFIRAGVIPRLHEQGHMLVLHVRPGSDPFGALAHRLIRAERAGDSLSQSSELAEAAPDDTRDPVALASALREEPGRLALILRELATQHGASVLLHVDQLEALFTHCDDPQTQEAFLDAVCAAADDAGDPVRAIFSVRDDYLGAMAVSAGAREALRQVTVLRRPGLETLKEVLVGPARLSGYRFEDDQLAQEMAAEVVDESAALPLLSFAADQLWELRDRDRKLLLRAAYVDIGGVAGALATHADGVLAGLSTPEVGLAREVLLRMVSADRTRRTARRADVLDGLPPEAEVVMDRLVDARLLAVRRATDRSGQGMIELAHESLVTTWPTLRAWLDESREDLTFYLEVSEAATRWRKRGEPDGLLWRGDELAEARRTRGRMTRDLPRDAADFLDAASRRETSQRRRRRLLVASALTVLTAAAVVLAVLSGRLATEKRRAERQRSEALIEDATSSFREGHVLEARGKLRAAYETHDSTAARALAFRLAREPLLWRADRPRAARAAVFAPGGEHIAVGGDGGSLQVFDAATGEATMLRGHHDQITSVDYDESGSLLASADLSGRVLLWNPGEHRANVEVRYGSGVTGIAFVPGSDLLLVGGRGREARLYDTKTGALVRLLIGSETPINSVHVSPDGSVAAIGTRGALWLVPLDGGARQRVDVPGGLLHSVQFSHDGRLVAFDVGEGEIALHRTEDAEPVAILEGHQDSVVSLRFSADDRLLLSGSYDMTVRLWDVATRALRGTYRGHESFVYAVDFSPDGASVVSTSYDETVRLWRTEAALRRTDEGGHVGAVTGVAMGPSGDLVASSGTDGTVRTWSVDTGTQRHVLRGHGAEVWSVAISPDGQWISSASSDRSVRLWDVRSGIVERVIGGHVGDVDHVEFSPDGQWVASCGADRTVRVWSVVGDMGARVLRGHQSTVYRVAFDLEGARLASASSDQTVRIWDVATGLEQRRITRHRDRVRDARFAADGRVLSAGDDGVALLTDEGDQGPRFSSPGRVQTADVDRQGRHVLVAGADSVIRLWTIEGEPVRELRGHLGRVWMARFSVDGTRIVSAGGDGTVRVWAVDDGRQLWRAPLLLRSPFRLLTNAGWTRLDADGSTHSVESTLPRELESTLAEPDSRSAARGDTLCVANGDVVERWRSSDGVRLTRATLTGVSTVRALDDACVFLSASGLARTSDADIVPIALPSSAGSSAVAVLGDSMTVATDARAFALDEEGVVVAQTAVDSDVTALSRTEAGAFVVGYRDGSLELRRPDAAAPEPLERLRSVEPVRVLMGPRRTVIVGFADGTVAMWDLESRRLLATGRVHGPAEHLALDGDQLVAASELGDTLVWDLSAFTHERCDVLRAIWAEIPVVWRDGELRAEPRPADHECAE